MSKSILLAVAATAFTLAAASSQAAEPSKGLQYVVNVGLTGGGDTIGTAQFTNGHTENIKAGALVQFGAGIIWQSTDFPMAAQFTANYQVADTSAASNGSIKFSRIPLEAIAYYTGVEKWRMGAGARFVQSPRYKASISGTAGESLDFKTSNGALVEIGYAVSPNAWLNFRFVSEKYQPTTYRVGSSNHDVNNAAKIDGSHVGVNFSYQF